MNIPLVLLPDGSLVRMLDVPTDGIIVPEPPESKSSAQDIIGQTAAVSGRIGSQVTAPPRGAKSDV